MAQPQEFTRTIDFTERDGDDTNHAALNEEFDAAALSVNQIRDNMAQIQRDDGALKNEIVTADSLAPSAFASVLSNVNTAVGQAQTASESALTSATTANAARDDAIAARVAAETAQTAAGLNASITTAQATVASANAATAVTKAAEAVVSSTLASDWAVKTSAAVAGGEFSAKYHAQASGSSSTASAGSATASAGSATTATTQAGNSSASAAASLVSQNAASTSAGTATTQAGVATTQAALATTNGAAQVALATTQANASGNSATAANASANTATTKADEAAASAASIAGGPVASIAGLTGAVSAAAVKTALSISNVTDAALNLKANALQATRSLFSKADSQSVAFTKTGNGSAQLKAGAYIDVNGTLLTFATATTIVMPTLTAGVDYAIYACTDGTVRADASFSAPSGYTTATSRKIGGFHYAPGGNATAQAGGNTTAQINEYSFWDLKFKPACPDPRGMALVADGFWADIYLLGVDHLTNGTSKYNVTIADGSSPPKIPTKFGGNGTTAYGSLNWWEAAEVLAHHGKRPPSYSEFAALAYGTTEASSGGTDPGSTILRAAYTSKWGVMLASGNMWQWSAEFGGGAAAATWTANTGGRGSTNQMENAAIFGGSWAEASNSGSRCSAWRDSPTNSGNVIGSRGVCDPLILE